MACRGHPRTVVFLSQVPSRAHTTYIISRLTFHLIYLHLLTTSATPTHSLITLTRLRSLAETSLAHLCPLRSTCPKSTPPDLVFMSLASLFI